MAQKVAKSPLYLVGRNISRVGYRRLWRPCKVARIGRKSESHRGEIFLFVIGQKLNQSRRAVDANHQHARRKWVERASVSDAAGFKNFPHPRHNIVRSQTFG